MRVISIIALLGLFLLPLTTSLEGLLPPLYQTSDEIVAVLKDKEFGNVLPDGEPIVDVKKIDNGYLITTLRHQVKAFIEYAPALRPGPAQFKVQFQTVEKISSEAQ